MNAGDGGIGSLWILIRAARLMMDRSRILQGGAGSDDGGRKSLQAEMRRDFPVRTDERRRGEMERTGSCCTAEILRRRTEQQFGRGDSFYEAHGSTATWATPGETLSRWGDSLCWRRLLACKT